MKLYPKLATERFDNANFHIKYCLQHIKKHIKGNVLEVGAGCGSFTRNYINQKIHSITLTEFDDKNILDLEKSFASNSRVRITKNSIYNINQKFDTIVYLHVLEHIKNDKEEIFQVLRYGRFCLNCQKKIRDAVTNEQMQSIRKVIGILTDICYSDNPIIKLDSFSE